MPMGSITLKNRTDEYAADTVENRTRFMREIIEGIKARCGKDVVIQILMDAFEENDAVLGDTSDYVTIEQSIEDALAFEAAGADSF